MWTNCLIVKCYRDKCYRYFMFSTELVVRNKHEIWKYMISARYNITPVGGGTSFWVSHLNNSVNSFQSAESFTQSVHSFKKTFNSKTKQRIISFIQPFSLNRSESFELFAQTIRSKPLIDHAITVVLLRRGGTGFVRKYFGPAKTDSISNIVSKK